MMGNYHVRFLEGKGVVTPLTYPVRIEFQILRMKRGVSFEQPGESFNSLD